MFYRRYYAGAAALAVVLMGIAVPAVAPLAAADKVQIEITGNLVPSCGNGSVTYSLNAGDITKAGSAKFTFAVDCNAPFQYTMQSENGALRLVNAPVSAPAASVEAPYDVHIRIPLTLGGAIDDVCNSAAIKQGAVSCKFTDSGRHVAIGQQGEAQISWKGTQNVLAAGQYSDRLTIFLNVKL